MGSTTVEILDEQQLEQRIADCERRLGMTVELAERIDSLGGLNADEYEALHQIRNYRWLLGSH